MADTNGKCALCGLEEKLTKHHLIPRVKCHSNKYDKGLRTSSDNFLWICETCHRKIHSLYTENELRDMYYTRELLLESEDMKSFIKWRIKHPGENSSSKMSNRRK